MDEKLVQAMNESRFISAADNVIFPLIDQMIQDRLMIMCGNFRSGETDHLTSVAAIVALQDLKITLSQKQAKGNREFEKLNKQLEGKN